MPARPRRQSGETAEAKVELRTHYPDGEPPLGTLAYDLLEVDRSFRDALREARLGERPAGREGWPRLSESPRVVRATTRSPLSIDAAAIVDPAIAEIIGGLVVAAILSRFRNRPKDSPPTHTTIIVLGDVYNVYADGQEAWADREPEAPDGEPETESALTDDDLPRE